MMQNITRNGNVLTFGGGTIADGAPATLDFSGVKTQNLADEVIGAITEMYDGKAGTLDQFATWVAVVVKFDEFAQENGLTSFAEYDESLRGKFKAFLDEQYGKDGAKYFPFCEIVLSEIKNGL